MKYVIIGNSTAAVGCIEGIRENDLTNEIVVISDETPPHIRKTVDILSALWENN